MPHPTQPLRQAIACQFLAAAATLLPLLLLNPAILAGNTDGLFYCIMLKLTAGRHLLTGWLTDANGGAGSPAGIFYAPMANWLTAFLGAPLAAQDPSAFKRLLLGMFAAQWLGGIGAYLWLARHVSPRHALLASLLFTLFPYKWIYIYLHVNLAQLWALAFLPPLMIAAEDIAHGKRNAGFWYAIWLALLACTHPRTLVAFGAVPALYALLFQSPPPAGGRVREGAGPLARNVEPAPTPALPPAGGGRSRIILSLATAHLLALALSAFYLLPALLNLNLVQSSLANIGKFNYAENLSHRDVGLNFHYAIIACLAIAAYTRVTPPRRGGPIAFWSTMLGSAALLCLRFSQPLWDALPPLQFLQFPAARLHAIALMSATMLAAIFFELAAETPLPPLYKPLTLWLSVVVMTAITAICVANVYHDATGIDWAYIEQMHAVNPILPPEYLTIWQHQGENTYQQAKAFAAMPAVTDTPTGIIATQSATLRHLYWPQWQAPGLTPDANGLMQLTLPEGGHDTLIPRLPLQGEIAGKLISLIAWLSLLTCLIYRKRRAPNSSLPT